MIVLKTFCLDIHNSNRAAGWWTDLATGESIVATRNRPEMLMLVVSELSEASEGASDGLMDDKLPHLPMFDVELADAAIRLADLIGADVDFEASSYQSFWLSLSMLGSGAVFRASSLQGRLMALVNEVSRCMEYHRKGKIENYRQALIITLARVFQLAELHDVDLLDVIAQKRAYNATRADHQIANRKAAGGKQY